MSETEISATLVKQLRDATNVSMMECKRALVEAGGDMDKAARLLRERGMAVAAKKATRTANQGLISSATAENGKYTSLVEVNCETDFVARNSIFQAFVAKVAGKACETDANLGEVLNAEVVAKVAEIGENIVLRRNLRYTLQGLGGVAPYIHLGGKVGVMVELGCTKESTPKDPRFQALLKDLTLQVAAASPRYLVQEEVPAAEIASEREIYAKQITDKPAQIVEKIVDGKIKKYCQEICLLDQPFVKEVKQTIRALLAETSKELGDTLTVRRFARYKLGE